MGLILGEQKRNSGEKSRAYLHLGSLYRLRQGWHQVLLERGGKCEAKHWRIGYKFV